jgi:drug/metabolite transporter (DMT)-like permease
MRPASTGRSKVALASLAVSWSFAGRAPTPAPALKPLLGISYRLAAAIVLTVMQTLVKLVTDTIPTGEIVFFRSFFALIPLLIWLGWLGELPRGLATRNLLGHARRSLCSTCGQFCGFFAVAYLAVADATAIGFVAPLLMTLLAVIVLKEKVHAYRWGALALGFVGMVIMLAPYFGAGGPTVGGGGRALGASVALAGALFSAVASLEVRRLAQSERTGAIVFYFSAIASLFGLLTWFHAWASPTPRELVLLVSVGVLGGIGQIFLTSSFRHAPMSLIAPFDYTTLIWAMLLGLFVFGQVPELLVLVGAVLVIIAGLIVIWRESVLGMRARKDREEQRGDAG